LVVGLLVATWAVHLGRRVAAVTGRRAAASRPPWQAPLAKALVGVLVALGLFWEVTNYAGVVGRGYGQRLAAEVAVRTGVVVYSPKRLYIQAPGVREDELADPDAAYRFRYSGLRLLQRSGGKYFLLPAGWTLERAMVIVIPDDDAVRFEFMRGGR